MERQRRSFNKAGRFLTERDIELLDTTLFAKAIERCYKEGLYDEDGSYYKGSEQPSRVIDGTEYFPSFYSTMDRESGACRHTVTEITSKTTVFASLTVDEQEIIRNQFPALYLGSGGDIDEIADDEEWQALHDPTKFSEITVQDKSVLQFGFTDTSAVHYFSAARILLIDPDAPWLLGEYDLNTLYADEASVNEYSVKLSPEDVDELDDLAEAVLGVTSADVQTVARIMDSLNLTSKKDRAYLTIK